MQSYGSIDRRRSVSGRKKCVCVGVIRVESQYLCGAGADEHPVVLANGLLRLVEELVDLALNTLAGHLVLA